MGGSAGQGRGGGYGGGAAGGVPSQLPQLGGNSPQARMDAFQARFPQLGQAQGMISPWLDNMNRGGFTPPGRFRSSTMASMFRPGDLPITTTQSVAGTQASPVGHAAEGGSGVTDPSAVAAAQPAPSTSSAPSQALGRSADIINRLRSRDFA